MFKLEERRQMERDLKEVRKLKDKAAALLGKEKFKKAIKVYEAILKLQPGEVTIMIKVGELLRRLGRNAEAVAAYCQAAEYYAKDGMLVRAMAMCKELFLKVPDMDLKAAYEYTADLIARMRTTEEAQEGMKAFLEKRKPGWYPEGKGD